MYLRTYNSLWLKTMATTALFLALSACSTGAAYQLPEFESFEMFVDTLETAANGSRTERNAFWNSLVAGNQVPFIRGEQVAFLYRGKAKTVSWVGDFTRWQNGPALQGHPVGQSDIWVAYETFPTNAEENNYPFVYLEVPEGHSWGQWRAQLDDLLLFFFNSNRVNTGHFFHKGRKLVTRRGTEKARRGTELG